jgi:hypothetical protein
MSLKSFVALPDVKDKIKPLHRDLPRKITDPLLVKPHSKRYGLVGTAFDYLLRFELQRRAPHAVTEPWVAERAPDIIWRVIPTDGGKGTSSMLKGDNDLCDAEDSKLARAVLGNAKAALVAHLENKSPTRDQFVDLAVHAIRLAKLDLVYRAGHLDPRFEQADSDDVEDLLDMLEIVPFDSLSHSEVLLLNPTFKNSSQLVGGADADLIAGDLLVDFKVTKDGAIKEEYLNQLLGYFLLARNQRRLDPKFPEINRGALYFCRHGHLWPLDVTAWTEHSRFTEIEDWFFMKAKEVQRQIAE